MSRPKNFRNNARVRSPWAYVLLIFLAVLAAGVVAYSLGFVGHKSAPTAQIRASPSASASASPSASASASVGAGVVVPTRLLAAFDDSTAWRAVTGACPATQALPLLTTDGGTTWKRSDATKSTRVTAIESMKVAGKTSLEVMGLSAAACVPQLVTTTDAGSTYVSAAGRLTTQWYVNPRDRSIVHSPTGDHATPCVSVVVLSANAAKQGVALCSTGTLIFSADNGSSWAAVAGVGGAVNVSMLSSGFVVAAVGQPQCLGIQILVSDAGKSPLPTGCLPTAAKDLSGEVAISVAQSAAANSTVWLWAGDVVKRSTNYGLTWR